MNTTGYVFLTRKIKCLFFQFRFGATAIRPLKEDELEFLFSVARYANLAISLKSSLQDSHTIFYQVQFYNVNLFATIRYCTSPK